MIDASHIIGSLYQGGMPPEGRMLADGGYALLVLCAEEYQPEPHRFPGLTVVHAPNDDSYTTPPTRHQLALALRAARQVADALLANQRVLVTCMQGRNRSGLVTAMALHLAYGCSGASAIRLVRSQRKRRSLGNPHFVACLERLAER